MNVTTQLQICVKYFCFQEALKYIIFLNQTNLENNMISCMPESIKNTHHDTSCSMSMVTLLSIVGIFFLVSFAENIVRSICYLLNNVFGSMLYLSLLTCLFSTV